MIVGHLATAMVAYQQSAYRHLLYFLIASQIQDLLWFIFHFLDWETTAPSSVLAVTAKGLLVDMIYSHDLVPQLLWALLVFCFGWLWFKSLRTGLLGAALVFIHFGLDLLAGYPHHIFGPETSTIGFAVYLKNPALGVAIEFLLCAFILVYFFKTENRRAIRRSVKNKWSLLLTFAFGMFFLMFIAEKSIAEHFQITQLWPEIHTTIPSLIVLYSALIYLVYRYTRQPHI